MKIIKTKLDDIVVIEPEVYGDSRGFFMETYNKKELYEHGIKYQFVQDNHSLSKTPGTLRGLHYQATPMAQTKLVRVLKGAIYDVAVDIRKGSKTFGHWVAVILSETNHRQLLIPKGFAHGFCTLVEDTHVMYKVDQYYSAEYDRGIAWNDPQLGIDWPTSDVILSQRDMRHPSLHETNLFNPSVL